MQIQMHVDLLSQGEINEYTDLNHLLKVVENTYVETARDRVINPPKLTMNMGDDGDWPYLNAFAIDMPAYVDWLDVAGVKWAVGTWDVETDMPVKSVILLFDVERGQFEAILEGMHITGVRTAMQSVVGLQNLSPGTVDTVGVLGAGFQARFQLPVIDALCDIDTFKIFDPDDETLATFVEKIEPGLSAEVVVCDAPSAVVQSEVIVTVTNSKNPVIDVDAFDHADMIIALGTYQELTDDVILDANHLVVDHIEQCLRRGALSNLVDRNMLTRSDIDVTIGDVLNSEYENQIQANETVIFVPIGLGSLDIAIAKRIYESRAEMESIQRFNLYEGSGSEPSSWKI